MFCPKCGKINPDNAETCSGCSTDLHEQEVQASPKKKGKALKLIITAVIVIAVVVAVVVLLNGCANQPSPKDSLTF